MHPARKERICNELYTYIGSKKPYHIFTAPMVINNINKKLPPTKRITIKYLGKLNGTQKRYRVFKRKTTNETMEYIYILKEGEK